MYIMRLLLISLTMCNYNTSVAVEVIDEPKPTREIDLRKTQNIDITGTRDLFQLDDESVLIVARIGEPSRDELIKLSFGPKFSAELLHTRSDEPKESSSDPRRLAVVGDRSESLIYMLPGSLRLYDLKKSGFPIATREMGKLSSLDGYHFRGGSDRSGFAYRYGFPGTGIETVEITKDLKLSNFRKFRPDKSLGSLDRVEAVQFSEELGFSYSYPDREGSVAQICAIEKTGLKVRASATVDACMCRIVLLRKDFYLMSLHDGSLHSWDLKAEKLTSLETKSQVTITNILTSRNGDFVVCLADHGMGALISVYSGTTLKLLKQTFLKLPSTRIALLNKDADLLVVGREGSLKVYSLKDFLPK